MPYESDIVQACLHRRVFQQAERTPARVAVRCGEQALNYAELARRVNALARLLRERGVRGETPVGVLLPRTIDLPAALLGVMAAGGAYVPLDPAHPAERINFILDDIAAPFVITTTALAAQIDLRHAVPLCLDALEAELAGYSTEDGPEMSNVAGLAYVIFTSGSTGRPKGVMIEHRNVNCMLAWAHAEYSEHELSRVVAATSITFDLSVFEIFAPLTMGGTIDIIDNGLAFATSAGRHAATLLNTVPSVLRELLAQQALPEQLKVINLAGEPLPLDLVRQIYAVLPDCRVYNLYGPSEDTTYSTGCVVPPDEQRMTVGRPLLGRHLYLLDASGAPVIPGEEGEIHVGGPGVTRGYWNRAALSASVFLPDPQYPGRAMYRTGDFGRQLADGRIEFLGRRDDQIKLRGFRIELGEIEMTLRAHSAVAAAAVVGMDSDLTGPYLRCAIEASADVNAAALAAWSASRLPAYMVPTDWHILAQMPLLPNGKTDRNAIRALARQSHAHARSAELSTEQAMLAALWQELLGVRPVHPEDSFFALGGHSILAVRLARRIADTCGAQVDAVALLRHPTLAAQAALLPSAARTAALQHRQDQRGPAPATPAQQRYWTLESLQPGGCRYNIAYAWRFAEAPDWRQLDQALCAVLRNATALRTVCVPVPAGIAQQVVAAPDTVLQTLALNGEEDAHREAAAFAARPFQLEREIPLRALAINVAGGASLLVIVTHHIAADGSAELIQAAVTAAYRGESLPPGTSSIDAAGWLHGAEHGAAVAVDQRWWAAEFSDPPQPLALPADRAPATQPRGQGGQVIVSADAGMRARLTAVCAEHAVTPFHALLALSWAYLARLCGQDDICVAVPVTDRPHPGLSDAIGCFVNTVLMRGQVNLQSDIATLLRHARERALAAQAHSRAPIDRVVGANACLRMGHGGIVANVMLSVLQEAGALTLGSAHGEPVDIELPASRFDLSMFFRLSDDGIRLVVEYDGERFDRTSARRIGEGWMTLARAALADPGLTVGMLPLLTPTERRTILDDWNATAVTHARVNTLHGMFLERAQRQPDAVAIRTDAGELSYAELAAQAALMAQCVLAAGARPGNRVAVLCDRQPYLVASLLGIMMAGCVYVPLDPDSPLLRHQAMLDVAGARLLVSDAVFAERARALAAHTVLTTIQADAPVAPHAQRALPADDVERLAYIIFTSGSTGTPKAVAVRHRPAHNLIDWVNRTHRVGPGDCLLFVTSVSFDLSVYDMFGMLAAGGTIRIAGRASVRDPQALARILVEEDVTFWDSAPIALDQCVPYLEGQRARALRLVFLSGDWVPVTLPDRIRACADAEVVALGGATEAVIWSNWHPVEQVQPGQTSIPYGRPIQNARYHILDHRLEPVPVGVAGDLYIGGDVLADGYYGDPALTAQRFIADPFGAPGQRLYRTGDRARYFADGSMEFLGRLDNQVKIRGYRIETSEIETALAAQVGVRAAHVAIRGERQARWLCAYVVTDTPDEPGLARRLAAALRARLPEYMLPRAIVPLAALPLNSSGKVDRARLPEPQFQSEAVSTSAAPITLMDKRVLAVWQEVLGRQDIGPDDNFFDVGGDSARLIATHRALESLAQRKLPLVDLFRHTTVRGLSAWLGATTQASAPPPAQRAGGGLARVAALRKSTRSPSTTKET
ncbi:non-ribosomal peptide synthetase [Massilia sp. CF038]|uniref:non-ribosomal peptide synthetase n=1 Tax=Massilia sp. CF038 TaxID=1881045 RepID=UPI00091E6C67|nr:non-ribosomal peptide synthetase [Massilia sp. CF038]SHG61244.1 fengycin family lipopeptide synthetase D [Massilia sp. CF038]